MIRFTLNLLTFFTVVVAVFSAADSPAPAESKRSDFDVISQRNIFSKTRSPKPQSPENQPSQTQEEPIQKKYVLCGIAIANEQKQIFVEDPLEPGVKVYGPNDDIDGFKIKEITAGGIVVADGENSYEILVGRFISPDPPEAPQGPAAADSVPVDPDTQSKPADRPRTEEAEILRKLMERRKQQIGN
jgi:type II secretory pathway component PulC